MHQGKGQELKCFGQMKPCLSHIQKELQANFNVAKIRLRWSVHLDEMPSGGSGLKSSGYTDVERVSRAPELAGGTIQCIPSGLAIPFGPQGGNVVSRGVAVEMRCLDLTLDDSR